MTCYHPNTAHITGIRESGTKIIKFGLPEKTQQETFLLPCGQCIGCRLAHSQQWAIRCMHEAQMHQENCFITLTYNEENVPHDGSLIPHHFQNFMKRLRKKHEHQIKYYMCGEYGPSVGARPHYHALLFNHDFYDGTLYSDTEGILTYDSPALEAIWGKGFVTVGELTIESAAYVARYCLKKINGEKANAHYESVCPTTGEIRQLQPEYSNMSRGGSRKGSSGLSSAWYDQFNQDIFPYDTTIHKGHRVPTPRYYDNLLRSSDQATYDLVKSSRKNRALKHAKDNTPDRLRQREICTQRKLTDNFNRKLHNET
nr:MAG: replication initiation protein [Microvirus sp.]